MFTYLNHYGEVDSNDSRVKIYKVERPIPRSLKRRYFEPFFKSGGHDPCHNGITRSQTHTHKHTHTHQTHTHTQNTQVANLHTD
jgi:hypothetical protein